MHFNRVRILLVSMLAVFAFGALTVSAASALEKYEFLHGGASIAGKKFTGPQVGNSILRATGLEITCTSGSSEGTFAVNTSKVEKVKVTFNNCTSPKTGGGTCTITDKNNPEIAEGEIKTGQIKGTLGEQATVGALESNVGLDLEPEGSTTFVELEGHPAAGCPPLTKIKGSVIGQVVSPINEERIKGTLKFAENGTAEQLIQNIEEEGSEGTVDNGDVLTGFTAPNRLINESKIELVGGTEKLEVHTPAGT